MEIIRITDEASGSSAQIAAHLGFNCFDFRAVVEGRAVEVIDAHPGFSQGGEKPSWNGIPLLFPFPNRIRGGRFTWSGKEYHLPEGSVAYDAAGNAIHGFCLDRPWRVTESTASSVTGAFQLSVDAPDRRDFWPEDFLIEVKYTVQGATLRSDIRIVNPGDSPLPWGFGTHSYFRLPLSADSSPGRCLVQAPASQQWELEDCLPTGVRSPVTESQDLREGEYYDVLKLDDVLTGLPEGDAPIDCQILDEQAGLQVTQRFPSLFRELVAFTPPWTKAVCLEPYTCVTDAINLQQQGLDAGWKILDPGQECRTWIEINAGLILA